VERAAPHPHAERPRIEGRLKFDTVFHVRLLLEALGGFGGRVEGPFRLLYIGFESRFVVGVAVVQCG